MSLTKTYLYKQTNKCYGLSKMLRFPEGSETTAGGMVGEKSERDSQSHKKPQLQQVRGERQTLGQATRLCCRSLKAAGRGQGAMRWARGRDIDRQQ